MLSSKMRWVYAKTLASKREGLFCSKNHSLGPRRVDSAEKASAAAVMTSSTTIVLEFEELANTCSAAARS